MGQEFTAMLVSISEKKKQTSQQTGSAYREDTKQAVNRYSYSDTAINKCTCSDLTWIPMWRFGQSITIFSYTPCLQMVWQNILGTGNNMTEAILHHSVDA